MPAIIEEPSSPTIVSSRNKQQMMAADRGSGDEGSENSYKDDGDEDGYEANDFLAPNPARQGSAKESLYKAVLSRSLLHNTTSIAQRTERRTTQYQKYLGKKLTDYAAQVDLDKRRYMFIQANGITSIKNELRTIPKLPRRGLKTKLELLNQEQKVKSALDSSKWSYFQNFESEMRPTKTLELARWKLRDIDIRRSLNGNFSAEAAQHLPRQPTIVVAKDDDENDDGNNDNDENDEECDDDDSEEGSESGYPTTRSVKADTWNFMNHDDNNSLREVRRQVTFDMSAIDPNSMPSDLTRRSVDFKSTFRRFNIDISTYRKSRPKDDPEPLEKTRTVDDILLQKKTMKANATNDNLMKKLTDKISGNSKKNVAKTAPTPNPTPAGNSVPVALPALPPVISSRKTNINTDFMRYEEPPQPLWQRRATKKMVELSESQTKKAFEATRKFMRIFPYMTNDGVPFYQDSKFLPEIIDDSKPSWGKR